MYTGEQGAMDFLKLSESKEFSSDNIAPINFADNGSLHDQQDRLQSMNQFDNLIKDKKQPVIAIPEVSIKME